MPVPSFVGAIGGLGTNACTPGLEVWATPGGNQALAVWFYVGVCPASGSISCNASLSNGATATSWASSCQSYGFCTTGTTSGTCFQAGASSGGGGGGSSGGTTEITGEVTLAPFEYTPEQQVEIYQSMSIVFGLCLGALALIWGGRGVLSLLRSPVGRGD